MSRMRRIVITTIVALSLANVVAKAEGSAEATFCDELVPLLTTHCFGCHGEVDGEGGVSLAADETLAEVVAHRKVWLRAAAQLKLGVMPPADAPPIAAVVRQRMTTLIEELASQVDCAQDPNAGKVTLRRLNSDEYRYTVADLTGVDYTPAKDFPGDDVGYGFDNIGDVLSLPPLLMERYLTAAEVIVGQAIWTPPPAEEFLAQTVPAKLINANKFYGERELIITSTGTVGWLVNVPFDGEFTLTLSVSGDQAGDEPVKFAVAWDKQRQVLKVAESKPVDRSINLKLERGQRLIEFSFLNDYYKEGKGENKSEDRNFKLHDMLLRGMNVRQGYPVWEELPASHQAIVFQRPSASVTVEQATAAVMGRFASRAFRRPVTQGELIRLCELAAAVRSSGGDYEESLQVAMQAVLVSPHFLYRVETPQPIGDDGTMPRINQYELATRISYFLWSTMPDDELLLMAHRGEIADRDRLRNKVGTMLADPRTSRFVERFASQWLQLRNLDRVAPSREMFGQFGDEIRDAMRTETLMFFSEVMRRNESVLRLLDADYTYLNERLANYYEIDGVRGEQFRKVSLVGTPRGGLLTQGSVLTVTSNPTRTSPVKRGKWILDNLLNLPPPPAPPNVPSLDKAELTGTLRQRMEQHRADPVCASCHRVMDPLGLALEHFDAVGRWRDREGREPVDASGELPDGTRFDGAGELRAWLTTQRQEQFVRAITEKMLTYALGRGVEFYDRCAIDHIVADLSEHENRFAWLIVGIIESDPFQKQGVR